MTVIKSELVDLISVQNPHLYRQDAEKIINTIFSVITAAMARGDRVELRGFGVFFVRVREGRTGRNPRTGALVSVGSKAVPFFRSGKEMKSLLNSYARGSDNESLTASLTPVTFRNRPSLAKEQLGGAGCVFGIDIGPDACRRPLLSKLPKIISLKRIRSVVSLPKNANARRKPRRN